MTRALVVVALITACRGECSRPRDSYSSTAPAAEPAQAVSVVPTLPMSEDGDAAMKQLDADIERAAGDRIKLAGRLLERAAIRGWLDDYTRALAVTKTAVEEQPASIEAHAVRARAQLAVHAFADARATLAKLVSLGDTKHAGELQVELDHATGKLDSALAARKARVEKFPDAVTLTLYGAALADAGKVDEAIAQIPLATQRLRNNTPQYLAWLLFQWGRLYEQKGQLALARDFFAEAHRRLPAHVEVTAHLAEALAGIGDRQGAKALVLVGDPVAQHPSLAALGYELASDKARLESATNGWERYVKTLPSAFADHAARFYLGVGNNSKRALELAELNLGVRGTNAARALLVEAAMAENDQTRACREADALATSAQRRERFLAWRAYTVCGRTADAERLSRELGVARQ